MYSFYTSQRFFLFLCCLFFKFILIFVPASFEQVQTGNLYSSQKSPPPKRPPTPTLPNEKQDKTKEWNQLILFVKGKSFAYIYTCKYLFQVQTPKSKRERKKKIKRPSHPPLPPLQNLNWSLHVQSKKSIFTENKNKTNNLKELGSEWDWGSESQEEGDLAQGRNVGSGLIGSRQAWGLPLCRGHQTREAKTITPARMTLGEVWFCDCSPSRCARVQCFTPSHSHSDSHAHPQAHTDMLLSLWLCVLTTLLERWKRRDFFPLQVRRVHCPRLCLLWPHANIPTSSLDMFSQVSRLL